MSSREARARQRRNLDESESSYRTIDSADNLEQTDYQLDLERSARPKTRTRSEKENENPRETQPSTSKMVRPATKNKDQSKGPSTSRAAPAAATLADDESSGESSHDEYQSPAKGQRQPARTQQGSSQRQPSTSQSQQSNSRSPQRAGNNQTQQQRMPPPVGAPRRKQMAPVMRDIQKLQNQTTPLIPRAPFCRLLRELLQKYGRGEQFRITPEAIEALRDSSETYVTNVLGDAYLITLNRKQVTIQPKDLYLLLLLRGKASA